MAGQRENGANGQQGEDDDAAPGRSDFAERRNGRKIPRYRYRGLLRELAAGEVRRTDLARKYGVTHGAITHFAERHPR